MADTSPDGSPVDLYATLSALGEPELVHASVPAGAEILELGCGAGRITHGLLALGHPVVAVDQSAEMLSHLRGAETVLADIESLRLGREFPVVLLASHLVNTAEVDRRRRFLSSCRRHVPDDGVVILQRLDPAARWDETESNVGGVRVRMRDVRRRESLVSATAEYRTGDRVWRHPFTSRILDDAALDQVLAEAGLERRRWLDARCRSGLSFVRACRTARREDRGMANVIDHVDLVVRDLPASREFYEAALEPLGFALVYEEADAVGFGTQRNDDFWIRQGPQPMTDRTIGVHLAFVAHLKRGCRRLLRTSDGSRRARG